MQVGPIHPPVTPSVTTPPPKIASVPTATTTMVPPTPVPPQLLVDRDPGQERRSFGPRHISGQWLITRTISDTFSLLGLRGQTSRAAQPIAGNPLSWSPDGALLLFTTPEQPTTLRALEPTTGIASTVLTTTGGPILGVAWLQNSILYATTEETTLVLRSYRGAKTSEVAARLPERRLLDAGLLSSPDQRTAAVLVASTVSPTLQLYRFDAEQQQLMLLDQSTSITATARAIWSAQGDLAYNLGAGLRRYNSQQNTIVGATLDAQPLDWLDGVLARRADGALVRWRKEVIQPFDTGTGPLIVVDAQVIGRDQAVLLIGQQIWRVNIP